MTIDNVVDFAKPVRLVEIPAPKLRRMESECRLLAVLLESGVENWEGYSLALDAYRADEVGGGSGS